MVGLVPRHRAVRVLGGIESARRVGHVAPDVVEDVARGPLEKRLAGGSETP